MGVQTKYDLVRIRRRWLLAPLLCIALILGAHGVSAYPGRTTCNGGWLEASEFLAEFLGAVVFIEAFQWLLWAFWEKPSLKIAPDSQAKAMSGGSRLLFVPQTLFWSLVFMAACFGVFKWAGYPDPCEVVMFSWRNFLGCVSFACEVLGLANLKLDLPTYSSRP